MLRDVETKQKQDWKLLSCMEILRKHSNYTVGRDKIHCAVTLMFSKNRNKQN